MSHKISFQVYNDSKNITLILVDKIELHGSFDYIETKIAPGGGANFSLSGAQACGGFVYRDAADSSLLAVEACNFDGSTNAAKGVSSLQGVSVDVQITGSANATCKITIAPAT